MLNVDAIGRRCTVIINIEEPKYEELELLFVLILRDSSYFGVKYAYKAGVLR